MVTRRRFIRLGGLFVPAITILPSAFARGRRDWLRNSPQGIPGLACWYAADLQPVADATLVSTIFDWSGNGHHLTAAGAARATYKLGIAGVKPIFRFAGAQAHTSSTTVDLSATNNITIFYVAKAVSVGSLVVLCELGNITSDNTFAVEQAASNCPNFRDYSGGDSDFLPTVRIENSEFGAWAWMVDRNILAHNNFLLNNCVTGYYNGLQYDGSNSQGTSRNDTRNYANKTLRIGDYHSSSNYWQGDLAEFMIYNRRLSMLEFYKVNAYLLDKYALCGTRHGAIYCDGDSLTAGTNTATPYPNQLTNGGANSLAGVYDWGNYGIGSNTCSYWFNTSAGAYNTAPYKELANTDRYQRRVAVLWLGTNDNALGFDYTATQNQFVKIVQWLKERNLKVVVLTMIPRADGTPARWPAPTAFETFRGNWNTWIAANQATIGWDAVADVAANVNLQDPTNTTYFTSDKVHLNDTGQGIVAGIVKTSLQGLGFI